MGNVLGEPFKDYVLDEIQNRQNTQGSGFLEGSTRTATQIQHLSNRNAWVKLASSVSIDPVNGVQKLKDIGINSAEDNLLGDKLAKKSILFNGLSTINLPNNSTPIGSYSFRSGVTTDNSLFASQNAYGIGGTNYGIQPMPGITSVSIECVNRGSIKKANVEIIANNKFQFEIIELLYLRLGYTILLEFGWDSYLKDDTIESVGNTLTEDFWFNPDVYTVRAILEKIEKYREKYHANYDAFLGKVTNFTWKFNPDGTYSITLNLVTMGDVIESLKVNTTKNSILTYEIQNNLPEEYKELKENNSPIIKGAPNSELGEWLYTIISWGVWNNTNYPNFFQLPLTGKDPSKILPIPQQYRYFITLKELLQKIHTDIIPDIKSSTSTESILEIDYSPDNYVSVVNKQLSLDPRICLIRPDINSNLEKEKGDETAYLGYEYSLRNLNKFFLPELEGFNKLGYLNNIYLNLDFISNTLNSNTDSEGNISLYKFVETLCNGINIALGNTCNLEPVLLDDKVLTIIDQNPSILPKKSTEKLFEVFGYNENNGSSNFVKNISFTTKITPKMATQISIGATADGTSAKSIQGTAFQKWNSGLIDRFSSEIIEKTTNIEEQRKQTALKNLGNVWEKETFGISTNPLGEKTKYISNYGPNKRTYPNVTKEQFLSQAYNEEVRDINYILDKKSRELAYTRNWTNYRTKALTDPFYPLCDDKQIRIGKNTFKDYLTFHNNNNYIEHNNTSIQSGFIPLEFQLDVDGISGVKIYQKLKINNKIFPPNYPQSLDFIITKIDHKISDNNWTTSLATISTSNIDNQIKKPTPTPIVEDIIPKTQEPLPLPTTPSSELWTLVAICAAENYASNLQGMADVAQSIYNRLAVKVGYGKTINAIVTGKNQYEPTFKNPTDWKNITDFNTAVVAYKNSRNVSETTAIKVITSAHKAITNKSLQTNAQNFIGSRTEFLAYNPKSPSAIGAIVREPDSRNNNFFWRYDGKKALYDKGITSALPAPKSLFA